MGEAQYTGVDNLEIMEEAVRYCAYLRSTVTDAAAPPDGSQRLLDFGAGTGTFARDLVAHGYDVVCLEPDQHLVDRLTAEGLAAVTSLHDVPDASIGLVYSFNVLEHIDDDLAALRSLRDSLRPGGELLLYVPAMPSLFSSMDRKVGHLRRYQRRPLARLVAEAGFTVDSARFVDSLGCLATWAYKVVGSRRGDLDPKSIRFYDRFLFPVSRALDRVTGRLFGKNLLVHARRS